MNPVAAPEIRSATRADHAALQALFRRASLANPGDLALLRAHPEFLNLPEGHFDDGQSFLAETDGQITGFATLGRANDGQAELTALFVDPDLWKQGLGRALLDEASRRSRAAGKHCIWVDGNHHAAGFYRRAGFVTAGPATLSECKGMRLRLALAGQPTQKAVPCTI